MRNDKIQLISAMVIWGTIGPVRKLIPYSSGLVAFARGVIGLLFLLVIHFARGEKFQLGALKKSFVPLCVSGVLLGVNWIFLFEAYRFTSIAVATICYYMAPVFVILVSPLLFHEQLTPKKGLCALAAIGGMVLVSGVMETGFSGIRGVLFGLGAALMYASVVILNKRTEGLDAGQRTIFQLGISSLALLPYVALTEDVSALRVTAFSVVMLLVAGIVHTGIAYALYFGSIRRVPAQTVAIFSYIDPVVAVLLSALVLREGITIPEMIGVVLVICSALASEVRFGKADGTDGR